MLDITGISLDGSRPPISQSITIQFPDAVCVGWEVGMPNCSVPISGLMPYTLYNFTVTAVTLTDELVGQPASVSAQTLEDSKSLGMVACRFHIHAASFYC